MGTGIEGMFYSYSEREEIADKLRDEGEYRIADAIRRGDCLGWSDLGRAERALDHKGMSRHFDYRETSCYCDDERER